MVISSKPAIVQVFGTRVSTPFKNVKQPNISKRS
jgi:hypothetical protein